MALVSSTALAGILELDRRRVEQLANEGMPRAARGKYDLEKCVRWYVAFLRKTKDRANVNAGFEAERTRAMRADASKKEIELARLMGELIPVEDAAAMWEEAIERIRSSMLASVSANARRVVGVKTIAEANTVLEEIVHKALAAAAAVSEEIEDGSGSTESEPR